MPSIFAYQSSEVDWCESNFQHSELVAELYNTVRAGGPGGRGAGGGTATGPGPRAWLLHVLWGSLSERFASLSLRLLICRVMSAGFHSLFVFTRHRAP